MIEVLRKIMWRTCKTPEVLSQIQIPAQTELVHYVTMSDLETFFYIRQHQECLETFVKNTQKIREREMNEKKASSMNINVLNSVCSLLPTSHHNTQLANFICLFPYLQILEPLRKLRQDCTVPSIFERNEQATIKRSLRPNELYKHLFSNCELECKSELRSIASSLNGEDQKC